MMSHFSKNYGINKHTYDMGDNEDLLMITIK